MIQRIRHWWHDQAADGVPDRSRFDPLGFPRLLSYMVIAEIEACPFRVRYRLVGTRVVDATGLDFTGHYFDEIDPAKEDEPWLEHYALCYETRLPLAGHTSIKTTNGDEFAFEFGIFPLSRGDDTVAQFLGIEDYRKLEHLFPTLEHWRLIDPSARN